MSLGYGEARDGQVNLIGEQRFGALLMSRLDFEVRVLDIPPVAGRDIEGLIGLRLRSVYPGNPKDTAFDYRVVQRGGVRRAVVFISRRATVDEYRKAAGRRPLLLPYLMVCRQAPKKGDLRVWVCNGRWAEHLVFHDGFLASSTVRRLARGKRFQLAQEEARLAPEQRAGRLLVAAPGGEIDTLEGTEGVDVIPLERLSAARREGGVFAEKSRRPVVPPAARLAGLGAVLFLLGMLVFFKYVRSVEAYDAQLRQSIALLQNGNQQVLAVQKEIAALSARGAQLDAEQPRDLYLLFSELSGALGESARIRNISVRDDAFQVDAVGTNPLKLMEGFKAHALFSNMRLAQVVPDLKTGMELFSFAGVFHGR